MRRQRVVRASSAQSLCIFCACRLGALELPATATANTRNGTAFVSSSRRAFSTTRPYLQSADSALATSADDNTPPPPAKDGPNTPPAWYDPTSPLTMSEQREKHLRVQARLQAEQLTPAQWARKEHLASLVSDHVLPIRRVTINDHGLPIKRVTINGQESMLGGKTLGEAMSTAKTEKRIYAPVEGSERMQKPRDGKAADASGLSNMGLRIRKAEVGAGRDTPFPAAKQRHRQPTKEGPRILFRQWSPRPTTEAQEVEQVENAEKAKEPEKAEKIAAPFFMQPRSSNGPSAAGPASAGWGMASTGTQPLRYSDFEPEQLTSAVQDAPEPSEDSTDHFHPEPDESDGQEQTEEVLEQELQYAAGDSSQNQAAPPPIFQAPEEELPSQSPLGKQSPAESSETGALESSDRGAFIASEDAVPSESGAPADMTSERDAVVASSETGAPESHFHDSTETEPKHPVPAASDTSQTPPAAANAPRSETRSAQPSVAPPTIPPPSLPPQASAAGQIVWQPVEGHAHGGRWVWEPATPAPAPAPAPTLAPAQAPPQPQQQGFQQSSTPNQGFSARQSQIRDEPSRASRPDHGYSTSQQQQNNIQNRPSNTGWGLFATQQSDNSQRKHSLGNQGFSANEQRSQQEQQPRNDLQQPSSMGYAPYSPSRGSLGSAQNYDVAYGSGYRAAPVGPDDFREFDSAPSQDYSSSWKHLRRKDQNAAAAQLPTEQYVTPLQTQKQGFQPPRNQFFDEAAWVDRAFENHKRERDQRQLEQQQRRQQMQQDKLQPQQPRPPRGLFDDHDTKNKKCARCGEMGHIARQCTSNTRISKDMLDKPTFPGRRPGRARDSNPLPISNPFAAREPVMGNFDSFVRDPPEPERPARKPYEPQDRSFEPFAPSRSPWNAEDAEPSAKEQARERRASRFTQKTPAAQTDEDGRGARSGRFAQWADDDEGVDDFRDTRDRKDKEVRRSQKYDDAAEEYGRGSGRKAGRGGRRELNEDEDDEAEAREAFRARKAARQRQKEIDDEEKRRVARQEREARKAEAATPISLPEYISVQQLSQMLGVRYEQFIDRLEELGYDDIFPGMTLNSETSGMIAMEYNFEPAFDDVAEEEQRDLKARPEVVDHEDLPTRPPVVTIMGHVDHGKTTILDYLRKSSVAAGEAGGITQHIGAFSVPLAASGKTITFLDTPGHAAFLAMRQRGANVTDIVILVVAADDSVKPQTLEAIKHAKAAGVPMIVAVNKIDKPEADIQRVKQDLARHGVEIEDYGGETQVVGVSGKTGEGMDELEENVVALSEQLDRRAEVEGAVEGWILEATTKKNGRVATVLVRRGTLATGTVIVAGKTWARVKTLHNEGGIEVDNVGPGMPVEVDGWRDQPMAGDEVLEAPTEQKATSVVEYRIECEERARVAQDVEAINESRRLASERQSKEKAAEQAMKQAQRQANQQGGTADVAGGIAKQEEQSGQIIVPFIIKADVSGSAEAVSAYIMSVSNPLIMPSILTSGVGGVHESDIELAAAAQAYIIAFNVATDPEMSAMAESNNVKILEHNIIYRVLDNVKELLKDKLPPIISQRVLGEAEIGQSFEIGIGGRKKMKIAGCKVRNGVIGKGSRVRVLRGSEKVYDGKVDSLKNVKKDVSEMRKGTECGMGFENWQGFEVGDQIQTYEEISERRTL